MKADLEWFYLTGSLEAWEDGSLVFSHEYDERVKRQFV